VDVGSRAVTIKDQRFERFPGIVGVGKRPGRFGGLSRCGNIKIMSSY